MTTLIKVKLKKSNDQTNIDKFKLAANNTEYNIIILRRIIIPKFMRPLFHVKNVFKNVKYQHA